jgi:hypothetical protein
MSSVPVNPGNGPTGSSDAGTSLPGGVASPAPDAGLSAANDNANASFTSDPVGGVVTAPCPLAAGDKTPPSPCTDGKLVSLTVIRNATQTNVSGAKNWATVKKATDEVVVEATTAPNSEACWRAITWSGDSGSPGDKPNQRKLSRAASKKLHVEAELGGVKDSLDVWVIWVDIEVKVGSGDTIDTGNDASGLASGHKWPSSLGGGNNLGPIDSFSTPSFTYSYAAGKIQAKGTLSPAGVEDVVKSGWSMRRKKTIKGFSNGVQYRSTGVDDDDTSDADWVDNDPKSGVSTREIYDLDAPGVDLAAGEAMDHTREVYKNFKQLATVTLDSELPCSDDKTWSYQAWIDMDKASGQIEKNTLSLSPISIPATAHYAKR